METTVLIAGATDSGYAFNGFTFEIDGFTFEIDAFAYAIDGFPNCNFDLLVELTYYYALCWLG